MKKTSHVEALQDPATAEPARRRSRQDDYLDSRGREKPDPIPLSPPIGYKKHPSLAEQIRSMVRSERLSQEARQAGMETFDEADDFDVGEDYDPRSPYEENFDPPVDPYERLATAIGAAVKPPEPPAAAPAAPAAPATPEAPK